MARPKRVGGYRKIPLGARVQYEPEAAAKELIEAFRSSGANAKAAAELLGVAQQTLHRWFRTLGLNGQIVAIRFRARREGWMKSARWPEKRA